MKQILALTLAALHVMSLEAQGNEADTLLNGMLSEAELENNKLDARIAELDREIASLLASNSEGKENLRALLDHLEDLKKANAEARDIIAYQEEIKRALGIN